MRFSIVTPVLNGLPWLPDAVESVAQQVRDVTVEHLVLDGGSTDGSLEWLLEHDNLGYRLVAERDDGQTDALARGFDIASGDILGWLNSDDSLEPGALARVSRAFEANPDAVIVSGGCLQIGPAGSVIGRIPVPPVSTHGQLVRYPTNLAQPATFFRAETYRQVGGLDRAYTLAMDVDLWLRLSRRGRIVTLPADTLARFRIHPGARSVANADQTIREDLRARRRDGMPWWSDAGRYFIRRGVVAPFLRSRSRSLRRRVGLWNG